MTERKWQMVKLEAGDWLVRSNDDRTVYRITNGAGNWTVRSAPFSSVDADPERFAYLEAWNEEGYGFPSRQAAVDFALGL